MGTKRTSDLIPLMCKVVKRMVTVRLLEKHGGKSGDWTADIDG